MSLGTSPADQWKRKWSNGVGKSEISLIWCVYLPQTMKQLKRPTSLISHWFLVEMVHNEPKLCKRKRFFLCCENFTFSPSGHGKWAKRYFFAFLPITPMQKFSRGTSRYAIWKLTPCRFRKCGGFLFYIFLNLSYCYPKSGQISRIYFAKLRC